MFTIILAVLLGLAIITIGVLAHKLLAEKALSERFYTVGVELSLEKYELQKKLEKRKERHLRASGHIQRQRALLEEKELALTRTNQIIELFLETFQGLEDSITITRNQARRLFVA